MGELIALLVGKSLFGHVIGEKLARAIIIVGIGLAVLGATWGAKCAYDNSVINHYQDKIQQRAKPATDTAANERARDTIAQAKNEEDAHNAVHSVPDSVPAGPSHQLACQRLHKLGRNPAACR